MHFKVAIFLSPRKSNPIIFNIYNLNFVHALSLLEVKESKKRDTDLHVLKSRIVHLFVGGGSNWLSREPTHR
jgi:hypothetical protein